MNDPQNHSSDIVVKGEIKHGLGRTKFYKT